MRLGIVFHIIDSIEEVGRQNKLRRVSTVTLELGEVSGVVHTYLEDCWHWAAARSQLLNARASPSSAARRYPVRGLRQHLRHGGARQNVPFLPSPRTHLVSGNEINIKEIEAC